MEGSVIQATGIVEYEDGAHWARIQKKVQKPPQSTHQIPGFFCQKIQKEWIVEEFSLVNFSKKIKNWQKSIKRVVIP